MSFLIHSRISMKHFLFSVILSATFFLSKAQTISSTNNKAFSLEEAINYATANNIYVKNVIIDQKITAAT